MRTNLSEEIAQPQVTSGHVVLAATGKALRTGSNRLTVLLLFWLALGGWTIGGMAATNRWSYTLLPGSTLLDDCPVCDRLSRPVPMRGSFDLEWVGENPLFAHYVLENVSFTAGFPGERVYQVTGRGSYQVGGEVALLQDLALEVTIDDGFAQKLCHFTNAAPQLDRLWPMIDATVVQTNGTLAQVYQLQLFAAPVRELWFSTAAGMTSGNRPPPGNHFSGGDLLSSSGTPVRANAELTGRLGIMPLVPDLGLDAADVLPGGEVVFSLAQDAFSETLGPLQHGDLLSERGRIVFRNQELTAAFGFLTPPVPDAGLDAVQMMGDGEVYFSIQKDRPSVKLGRMLGHGDLLSNKGVIVKDNAQLLARFNPVDPKVDHGLDAIHVWPSGEVWFSVETGFNGPNSEVYRAGDLLSDQGYVVQRNLELVAPFAPLEDLADFGLDALFVITDASPPVASPRLRPIVRPGGAGELTLEWDAAGRVSQVFRAPSVSGPWSPVSPVLTDRKFIDRGVPTGGSFYRLDHW